MKIKLNKLIRETLDIKNEEAIKIRIDIYRYYNDYTLERLYNEYMRFEDQELINIIKNYK